MNQKGLKPQLVQKNSGVAHESAPWAAALEAPSVQTSSPEIPVPRVVAVRSPNMQEFLRFHPDHRMTFETKLLYHGRTRTYYQVARHLWGELEIDMKSIHLVPAVNRDGQCFFWPTRDPGTYRRSSDPWKTTAETAIETGRDSWVRVARAEDRLGYRVTVATADFGEPRWPEMNLAQWVDSAFQHFRITDLNHPVVRELRGEE